NDAVDVRDSQFGGNVAMTTGSVALTLDHAYFHQALQISTANRGANYILISNDCKIYGDLSLTTYGVEHVPFETNMYFVWLYNSRVEGNTWLQTGLNSWVAPDWSTGRYGVVEINHMTFQGSLNVNVLDSEQLILTHGIFHNNVALGLPNASDDNPGGFLAHLS